MSQEQINYSNAAIVPTIYIDEGCDLPWTEFDFSDAYELTGTHKMVISADQQGVYPVKTILQGADLVVTSTSLKFQMLAAANTLSPKKYFWQIKKITGDIFMVLEGILIVNPSIPKGL